MRSQSDGTERLNVNNMIFAQHFLYRLPRIFTCVSL